MRAILVSLSMLLVASALAENPMAGKILIITGDHSHNWKETTPVLQEILTSAGNAVDVTETPRLDLTDENLSQYDALLLNYQDTEQGAKANPNSVWSDENKKAFADAIRSGTGLIVIHRASAAFTDGSPWSDEFEQIIAGGWRNQGKSGGEREFEVTIQQDHQITSRMKSFVQGTDELDENLMVTPGSTVLATAFDDREDDEPMVWVNHYGTGRVVQNALGHDAAAMQGEGYQELLVRCVEWAAEKGFRSIFDGKTLDGWEGNNRYWSVENGAITGQNPNWQPMPFHDFLCSVEEFDDFEVRLEAKVIGQRNSGVVVRGRREPMRTSQRVIGYEVDMGVMRWGWVYEEGGTRRLLNRDDQQELQPKVQAALRQGDFNDFVIRCEGNRIRSWINGVFFEYIDDDEKLAQEMRQGTIGFQLHFGTPQIVSFKNIRVKEL